EVQRIGVQASVVRLSESGDMAERKQHDADFWKGVEPGKLYAFDGTNLLAITMGKTPDDGHILDQIDHGTGTASVVAREDPNAIVVMIQANGTLCATGGRSSCLVHESVAQAMKWAASQPWIDIISVS